MTGPQRIRLSRAKGWRIPENTVVVTRGPGKRWGNPWRVGEPGIPDAAEAVRMFRARLPGAPFYSPPAPDSYLGRMIADLGQLRGKNLACWCALDAPCHADVLLQLANADQAEDA